MLKRSRQASEAGCQTFAQMDPQRAPPTFREDLEVSPGLRRFDHAKSVRLPGDGQVGGIVAGDLEKDSAVGPAFVGLARGVKESRAKFETGGHALLVT